MRPANPLYMFGSFIDITERKMAEIELRGAFTEIEELKKPVGSRKRLPAG